MVDIAVVSPTKIIACDTFRNKVILMNSTAGGVVASVKVPGKPKSLCVLNEYMAALTLSGQTVQFIKVGRCSRTLDTVLKVDKEICGITNLDDCLITSSSSPPGVEMLTLKGQVMRAVDNKKAGREVFKQPHFLTSSRDRCIYVSDGGTNSITKLDNKLNLLGTYDDPSLRLPRGILSIRRDQFPVCNDINKSIVLLNTRTGNTKFMLGKEDGLRKPWSLSYCQTQGELFVAPWENLPFIQAYSLR